MFNNIYNNTLRPVSRSSSPQGSKDLRPLGLRPASLRPVSLRPTGLRPVSFKGIREPDQATIAMSPVATQKMYEAANKVLENPDYVMNEKSIVGLFGDKAKEFIQALSNPKIQEDSQKIKQGLDLIA